MKSKPFASCYQQTVPIPEVDRGHRTHQVPPGSKEFVAPDVMAQAWSGRAAVRRETCQALPGWAVGGQVSPQSYLAIIPKAYIVIVRPCNNTLEGGIH